ncbi:MAG: hypothetical protein V2I62_03895 [Bacteroidales bacterium]|jgi:hypothetical protein|nr:hypothetical protein [Bacteroidales bacterium]
MNRSDFLFAKPSFIGGMASVLDLGATLVVYNESSTLAEADARAMASDWQVTGNDIKNATERWLEEHNSNE